MVALKGLRLAAWLVAMLSVGSAHGQGWLVIPDNQTHQAFAFDPFDGHLVDSHFIPDLNGPGGSNHIATEIMDTGLGTLAVMDLDSRAIYEYSYSGAYLRTISTDPDLLGMSGGGVENGLLYCGALNRSLISTDLATGVQNMLAPGLAHTVQDVGFLSDRLLVSQQGGVFWYGRDGSAQGAFFSDANTLGEQLSPTAEGGYVWADDLPEHGRIFILDSQGNLLHRSPIVAGQSVFGVAELGNGGILYTGGSKVFTYDPVSGAFQVVANGSFSGTFIDQIPVPEPVSFVGLALGALLLRRRRRNR